VSEHRFALGYRIDYGTNATRTDAYVTGIVLESSQTHSLAKVITLIRTGHSDNVTERTDTLEPTI
jgi:hypothetical protein